LPFQPIGNRQQCINVFLSQNVALSDVDYFVIEKKSQTAPLMAQKLGSLIRDISKSKNIPE
jgi:hypothetical protein